MNLISTEDIKAFHTLLRGAGAITVVSHQHPDGDAVGSTVAMFHYLEKYHLADVRILSSGKYARTLSFITCKKDRMKYIDAATSPLEAELWIKASDLIICLDCRGFDRTGLLEQALTDSRARKVLIDHHLNPAREDFDITISSTEVSSACELLFHTLSAMPEILGSTRRIPQRALYAIASGIMTDTNNFANSVFPDTMRVFAELLEAGIDRDAIQSHIYNEYREERIRLMGFLLNRKMRITKAGVAYIVLTKENKQLYRVGEGELEGIVNMPLAIKKVRMSIFVREENGLFRVSIRSKRGTSANRCAMLHFNGGGHELAAGGKLFIPENEDPEAFATQYIESSTNQFFEK